MQNLCNKMTLSKLELQYDDISCIFYRNSSIIFVLECFAIHQFITFPSLLHRDVAKLTIFNQNHNHIYIYGLWRVAEAKKWLKRSDFGLLKESKEIAIYIFVFNYLNRIAWKIYLGHTLLRKVYHFYLWGYLINSYHLWAWWQIFTHSINTKGHFRISEMKIRIMKMFVFTCRSYNIYYSKFAEFILE